MKKNFLKFLLLGVFTLSLGAGFVGCKDYDDDIDKIWEELDRIKTQIGTGVSKIEKGATDGTILVTYSDGSTNTVTVTSGGGSVGGLTIGADGYFYSDGTKTAYVASAGNPTVSSDGYLQFPNADGTYTKSTIFIGGGAYYVDAGGSYELYIAKQGSTTLDKITISKGSAGMTDLKLWGWIEGRGDASDDFSYSDLERNNDFDVNYAWIQRFQEDSNPAATANTLSNLPTNYVWSAQTEVVRYQILNTLGAERKGFIVQVFPANTDLSSMEFTLENSENEVLPITLGTPELITGLLTRAASSSGLYFIPTTYNSVTYTDDQDYLDQFKLDAMYSLVEKETGFRSNYSVLDDRTEWSAEANAVTSIEIAVNQVNGETRYGTQTITGLTGTFSAFEIPLNVDCDIDFNPTAAAKDKVVDYYVEAYDPAVASTFGFVADKANGTFKVTKMPDVITTAYFGVKVWKLAVDGKVYYEVIAVKPVADPWINEVVYDLEELVIKDATTGTPATPVGFMPKETINLTKMFDALGSSLAADWKSSTLGAMSVAWTMVDDADVTAADRFDTGAENEPTFNNIVMKTGASTPAVTTSPYAAQTIEFNFNYSDDATVPTATQTITGSNVTIERDHSYTITGTFKDQNGAIINVIKIKFKAVIPALSDMIAKRPAWWNSDQSVLNAYFPQLNGNVARTTFTSSIFDMTTGFTKLGSTAAADYTPLTLSLVWNQKIPVNGVQTNLASGTAAAPVWDWATMTNYNLQIWGTANAGHTAEAAAPQDEIAQPKWAYAQELTVNVDGAYLYGLYTYEDAEYDAVAFKAKPMSATKEGSITTASGTSINLLASGAGNGFTVLSAKDIWGLTYVGGEAKYDVFPTGYTSAYLYQSGYIYDVRFAYNNTGDQYDFVNDLNQVQTSPVGAMQYTDNSGATPVNYFGVGVRSSNVSQATTGKMDVIVTDVYGYVKTTTITLNFTL